MIEALASLERLTLLHLRLTLGQTTAEHKATNGAGTPQHFNRCLKALRLRNLIVEDGRSVWNLAPQQADALAVSQ